MNFALTRKLIVFGVVLPLAAIMGYSLASPQDRSTHLLVAGVTGLLLLPMMLKWYHPLLIFSWNAFINIFFLPGKPELWMLFTAIGFGIVVLNSAMGVQKTMIHVPPLTFPLLFLLGVVMVTAKLTGGIGVYALSGGQLGGSAIGGRGYFNIIAAIMGYFVLTSQAVPLERIKIYLAGFFLSGITGLGSNLAYMMGPGFYFLFYLFPIDFAVVQVMGEIGMYGGIVRIAGLAAAGAAVYYFMMARFGIRGIFDPGKPWRMVTFLVLTFVSLFGGYRSTLIAFIAHFVVQFYFERLFRTRLCAILIAGTLLGGALALPFVERMPHSVQRCFAFIPGVRVSNMAAADAENSTLWRKEMWTIVAGEIPNYLILGKGYSYNAADLYLENQAVYRGLRKNYDNAIFSGAYHNGPLSVIIPFGIFGSMAFLWFIIAGCWVLFRNYRYGDPGMQIVNTFLLAFFIGKVILFLGVFGALNSELYKFTGILGLSIAINRGVRKPADTPVLEPAGLSPQPASA